ncbi:MAG: hypothetical protein IPM53_29600 [Anaerolineaceae bacterium]|nr:hypothetical protein [Anaerolineaceae bacterium]
MRNWWIWLVMVGLVALAAACGGQPSSNVTECDFGGQTAVTLNILDEKGLPQRLVRVQYRLGDGSWEALPESVNEQAVFQEGPGTYQIRLEKSGYGSEEVSVVVTEAEDGSCRVTTQTVAVAMSPLECPAAEPTVLEIAVESQGEAVVVTAVTPNGRQELTCAQGGACQQFQLPLPRPGSYTVEVTGLAGVGPMTVEDGLITYPLRPSQVMLRQVNVEQTLSLSGADSVRLELAVTADEVGCPLADLRSLTAQPEPDIASGEPFPELGVSQVNNLLITDLSASQCTAVPQPYPVIYEASLPGGTPVDEVSVFAFAEGEWQVAECGAEDGRFLCTAVLPNPLVGQPYAYKIVAAGEEMVGTSLPFDTVCLVFD